MAKQVQILPCVSVNGNVRRPRDGESTEFYGVYVGAPGDFVWFGDFMHKEHALHFARQIPVDSDCVEIVDMTGGGTNGG